jgi:hypothetical protein
MKRKKYVKLFVYLFSALLVIAGCNDDNGPPPVINQAPVISGLNDLTLDPGFGTYDLDFANFVTDQEGEIITYQATNSDNSVITISLDNTVLTITEVGPGTSDITVLATDGNPGNEVSDTFSVTVEPITGAADYTGNSVIMFDFNGHGTGSVFDNPVPDFLFEGLDFEYNDADFGSIELANNDHLVILHNADSTYIWSETYLNDDQDCTGKKFRFDISFFTAPNLTDVHWEDDPVAADIQVYYVDKTWESTGGQYRFSALNLQYSPEWQSVEIPLSDFESLWEYPTDPSKVGVIGLEVWGGTPAAPISFRLDNFGIVD